MTAKELMDEYDKSGYCEGGTFGSFYYEDEVIEIMLKRFANNRTKELQAKILDFRVKMPLYTYLTIRDKYDEHFNLTTERYGTI